MLHIRVGKERIERKDAGSAGSFRPDDAQCVTKDIRSGGGVTTGHKDLTDGDDMLYVCVLTQCRCYLRAPLATLETCVLRHTAPFLCSAVQVNQSVYLMSRKFVEKKKKSTSKAGSRRVPYFFLSSPFGSAAFSP